MSQRKALLVGAGAMGQNWAQNLHACPEVELIGWMDIRPGAAAAEIEKLRYRHVRAFDHLEPALAQCKSDFVVDVTVPAAHHAVTIAALKAGAHVLGEKPMADSMEHARQMVRAAEDAGKLYMVSQSRRYDPRAVAFRELIRQHVGEPGILTSDFFLGPHFGGFREQMPSVLLLDMAIHTFDSARQISGADPLSVLCEEFNPTWSWFAGSAAASAAFEMTGKLRYFYRGCWCAEGQNTSWQSQWHVWGPNGAAAWDGENPPAAQVVGGNEGFIHPTRPVVAAVPQMPHGGIAGSLREFLHALDSGGVPQGECHDNIKSLAMVFAAVESAATKTRVNIRI